MEYILNHLDEGIPKIELNCPQSMSYENMCGANPARQLRRRHAGNSFENAGNADVIKLIDEPIPRLRPHGLLVRVRAAGLNRADILQRQGFYGEQPDFGDSVIPGLEISGEGG
jgi:hypothetical protein